jgi:hypothetical protein
LKEKKKLTTKKDKKTTIKRKSSIYITNQMKRDGAEKNKKKTN